MSNVVVMKSLGECFQIFRMILYLDGCVGGSGGEQ